MGCVYLDLIDLSSASVVIQLLTSLTNFGLIAIGAVILVVTFVLTTTIAINMNATTLIVMESGK